MKLILVRHGETEWVREHRYQGSTDVPLNQCGYRQAQALARFIRKERPAAIYSSKLMRAQETAKFIARACRKKVMSDVRLNEVSFGDWEGESHDGIRIRFPEAAKRWYRAYWSSKPPGGESLRSLNHRISKFLKHLVRRFSKRDETCVVVTHGGPIRMFLIQLLEMHQKIFWSLRIDTASISVVTVVGGGKQLVLLNSQEHLNGLRRGGKAK